MRPEIGLAIRGPISDPKRQSLPRYPLLGWPHMITPLKALPAAANSPTARSENAEVSVAARSRRLAWLYPCKASHPAALCVSCGSLQQLRDRLTLTV